MNQQLVTLYFSGFETEPVQLAFHIVCLLFVIIVRTHCKVSVNGMHTCCESP